MVFHRSSSIIGILVIEAPRLGASVMPYRSLNIWDCFLRYKQNTDWHLLDKQCNNRIERHPVKNMFWRKAAAIRFWHRVWPDLVKFIHLASFKSCNIFWKKQSRKMATIEKLQIPSFFSINTVLSWQKTKYFSNFLVILAKFFLFAFLLLTVFLWRYLR